MCIGFELTCVDAYGHVGTPQILPNVRANGFWENALFDKDGNFDLITAIKKAKKG